MSFMLYVKCILLFHSFCHVFLLDPETVVCKVRRIVQSLPIYFFGHWIFWEKYHMMYKMSYCKHTSKAATQIECYWQHSGSVVGFWVKELCHETREFSCQSAPDQGSDLHPEFPERSNCLHLSFMCMFQTLHFYSRHASLVNSRRWQK